MPRYCFSVYAHCFDKTQAPRHTECNNILSWEGEHKRTNENTGQNESNPVENFMCVCGWVGVVLHVY